MIANRKTVVFLGDDLDHLWFVPFRNVFKDAGWEVNSATSVDLAQCSSDCCLLIVGAVVDMFVADLEKWENRPPVIWCYLPRRDGKPPAWAAALVDYEHGPEVAPTEMLKTALKLVS
jgi:hypothetical protein